MIVLIILISWGPIRNPDFSIMNMFLPFLLPRDNDLDNEPYFVNIDSFWFPIFCVYESGPASSNMKSPHLHFPHFLKVLSQPRLFRSWNIRLLSSSSRATTTLTTSHILLTLIHSDFSYSACTNLFQLLQIWIASSSSSSFPHWQGPFVTKAFSIMNIRLLSSISRAITILTTCCVLLQWFIVLTFHTLCESSSAS